MWGRGRGVFLFDMCPTGIVYTVYSENVYTVHCRTQ